MHYIFKLLLISSLFTTAVSSCDSYSISKKKRAEVASTQKENISIGLVSTSKTPSYFIEGALLAIDELNQTGIINKKIVPIIHDDEGTVSSGQKIAKDLAQNKNVVAVVGHQFSNVAISSAVTYESNGILLLSHGATQTDFIRDGSQYTFRNIPSAKVFAQETALFVKRRDYKKIAIIYDRVFASRRYAELFQKYAQENNIEVVAIKSYSGWQKDYNNLIADLLKESDFDALLLSGELPAGAEMIKQIRGMGVKQPIISNIALDSYRLWDIAGKAAEGVIVATTFNPKFPKKQTRKFTSRFKEKYGVLPDTWAAQGYDAIKIVGEAIVKARSYVPIQISKALRFSGKKNGVLGSYSFNTRGGISDKKIFFKVLRKGSFKYLEKDTFQSLDPFETVVEETLRIPLGKPVDTIDPGLVNSPATAEIVEQLFLGLTDFDPKDQSVIPELALNWEVSQNKKTYRFRLRRDVKWTNGEPVTAHDIVYAIHRNLSSDTKSPDVKLLYIIKNAEAINKRQLNKKWLGVKAIDDFTIEFKLKVANPDFPALAGLWVFRPLPQKIIEKFGDQWTQPAHILVNGSYKLAAWEKGLAIILKRNTQYFDRQNIKIPEVRYFIIRDSAVSLAMYKNQQLDIMGGNYLSIPTQDIKKLRMNKNLYQQLYTKPMLGNYSLGYHTTVYPLNKVLVRKALTSAIDRKLITKQVVNGGQLPSSTYMPEFLLNSAGNEKLGIEFAPAKAAELLAKAGYPNGKRFPVLRFLHNNSVVDTRIAKSVKALLKFHLNINVELESTDINKNLKALLKERSPHIFQFSRQTNSPSLSDFLSESFHPRTSENFTGWRSRKFVNLLKKINLSTNWKVRSELFRQVEKIVSQEACIVAPIYSNVANYLINPRIRGWNHISSGGQQIRNWSISE